MHVWVLTILFAKMDMGYGIWLQNLCIPTWEMEKSYGFWGSIGYKGVNCRSELYVMIKSWPPIHFDKQEC